MANPLQFLVKKNTYDFASVFLRSLKDLNLGPSD